MAKESTKKAAAVDEDDYEEEETETEAGDEGEDDTEEETEEEEEAVADDEGDDEPAADDFRARAKKNVKEKGGKTVAKKKTSKVVAKKASKPDGKKTGKVVKMAKPQKEKTGPFRPTSTLNEAFEACKAGASEKELTAIAKKGNVTPAWLIGVMKKGKRVYPSHNWTWDVSDKGGKVKVSGVVLHKGKAKAA